MPYAYIPALECSGQTKQIMQWCFLTDDKDRPDYDPHRRTSDIDYKSGGSAGLKKTGKDGDAKVFIDVFSFVLG